MILTFYILLVNVENVNHNLHYVILVLIKKKMEVVSFIAKVALQLIQIKSNYIIFLLKIQKNKKN